MSLFVDCEISILKIKHLLKLLSKLSHSFLVQSQAQIVALMNHGEMLFVEPEKMCEIKAAFVD